MRKILLAFLAALCCATLFATEGALSGKFTVNANGDQIVFSQGNLQYQAVNAEGGSTWRFAEKQITYLDKGRNIAISETNTGWIDLFGWGTGDAPTKTSVEDADYSTFTDWGVNPISNGGNAANAWRTPTSDEWMYLFHERANADQLVGFATIGTAGSTSGYAKGVILLPDDWQAPVREDGVPMSFYSVKDKEFSWLSTYYYNSKKDNYTHNEYTVDEWALLERAGAVFLPVTGVRVGTEMDYVNNSGLYHSATKKDETHAYGVTISVSSLSPQSYGSLYSGHAVRLVQDVEKASNTPVLTFVDAAGSAVRQVEATLGEDFTEPRLTCNIPEVLRSVTYTSTNERIATVNATSGEVELVSAGTTTIIASFAGNDTYSPTRAVYSLIVKEATTPEPTCPEAKFYYNGVEVSTLTVKIGEAVSVPMLLGPTGTVFSPVSSRMENERVALITADGMIYGVSEGTTVLHVFCVHSDVMVCEYTLTIEVKAAQQKQQPELSFDPQNVSIELGEVVNIPTIVNPHNIEFTERNSKWYTNWDSPVAEVNEQTGEVIIHGIGDEVISFEFTGNDEFEPQIIGYNLHVSTTGLIIGSIVVRNSNKDDVLDDGGSVKYDPVTHTLTLTNAMIDQENFYHAPARNKTAKTEETMGAAIYYEDKAPLTIELVGGNAILNFPAAILSEAAPVVMLSPEGASGSARVSGTVVGIKAEALKLLKCDVTASSAVAVAVNELSVATGAHLMTYGQSFAIQANSLVLAEDNDGEGIGILTEGVTFEKGKGFFKDGKMATVVEIGKVVIPVPDDEVTTLDFTVTDPEGNESVIFSASAQDQYNEETGQVEISSTLTDEQVATTMEMFIPGSSEWMANLPGTIAFDIPAGQGTITIVGSVSYGYVLKLKIGDQPVITVTKNEQNEIIVVYDTPASVHVVLYLQKDGSASAPARVAAAKVDEEPAIGATISSIKITPNNAPQGIEDIRINDLENGSKLLLDGQLFILRDGKIYSAQGVQVR